MYNNTFLNGHIGLNEKKKSPHILKAHIPLVIIKYYMQNKNLKDGPAMLNLLLRGN